MKIGLGTVQFGLDYGVSNTQGMTTRQEAAKILKTAADRKVRIIDTAALYGSSEDVLGGALPTGHQFHIVTKTRSFKKDVIMPDDANALEEGFSASLSKLRAKSVYGLLLHDCDDLFAKGGGLLMTKMQGFKESGLVEKIGVSVYNASQIDRAMDMFPIDLIQIPISIFDQRLIVSGHLSRLKAAGVEIHARSVFLQGLLLMDIELLPGFFNPVRERLKSYHEFISREGLSPVHAAVGFVIGLQEIDAAVCGVNNHIQLLDILKSRPLPTQGFEGFAITDESILNPSRWSV